MSKMWMVNIACCMFLGCAQSTKKVDKPVELKVALLEAETKPTYNFDAVIDSPASFVIRNITLFDGEKVNPKMVVVVENSFIKTVCADGRKGCPVVSSKDIDGGGGFLMPSLIDSEGHYTLANEMLRDLLEESAPNCGEKNGTRYVAPSKAELVKEFSEKGLFKEIDTHGTVQSSLRKPRQQGKEYDIPQSANFEKHLRFGVTTVFDMHTNPWPASYMRRSNGKWAKANNMEQRELKKQFLVYADLFYPSMWAMPHNVQFHYFGVDPVYNLQPEGPWTAKDIHNWVQRRKMDGAFHIKLFYESMDGVMKLPYYFTPKTVAEIVKSAHSMGLYVVSHMQDAGLVENALNAGVDGFMHTPGDQRNDLKPETIEIMKKKLKFDVSTITPFLGGCESPYYLPTLLKDVMYTSDVLPYINGLDDIRLSQCNPPSEKPNTEETLLKNAAKVADAGVPLLTGVDAGDELAPAVEGLGVHAEMALIKTALQKYSKIYSTSEAATLYALKAATSHAATAFGMDIEKGRKPKADPRGYVKKGYRADLLLLKQSPFDNIQNTLKIKSVWKAGYLTNRQMVRPKCLDQQCPTLQIVQKAIQKGCPSGAQ